MDPLFSIIIANYNYGRFLEEAIQSVLAQIGEGANQVRPGEVELIIIDGGSSDNSVDVIKKYAGSLPPGQLSSKLSPLSSITYWVSEPDKGQSDAFNKGFAKARGRFLTWLNADDVMLPGTLAKLKAAAKRHPDCEWFVGGCFWLDPAMRIVHCGRGRPFSRIRARAGKVSVWGPSSFFTKRLLDSVGGVDERFHYMMDSDLWLRFARAGARYRPFCDYAWGLRLHPDAKMSQNNFSSDGTLRLEPFAPWNDRQRRAEEQKAREQEWMKESASVRELGRFERLVSASWRRVLAARRDFRRYRGRHYLSYFGGEARVLLSYSLQEYLHGLRGVADRVYAFNVWSRKRFTDEGNLRFINAFGCTALRKCAKFVDREGIDVLYAQGGKHLLAFAAVRWLSRRRPKLLVVCHSPPLWDFWPRAFAFVLIAGLVSDGMVFLVERYRRKWAWLTRLAGLKTYHVPNPVDVSRFAPREFPATRAVDGRIVLVNVGAVDWRKRQDLIVRTVAKLAADGRDVVAKIAGNAKSPACADSLRKLAAELGVADRVEFLGVVDYDKVPELLKSADVYVCPSDAEVMPFSILEAMATGLPVVAHDVAGIGEEVRDGENGHLVRSREVDDYVAAILDIVENNRFGSMGRAGRELAEREFATEAYAARMREVLASC